MAKRLIEIEALKHDAATRKDTPTAEFESVMREANKTPIQLTYERRNRHLDPQLVWHGNNEQDWSNLLVGQWGSIDILVEPYSQSTKGATRIVIFANVDVAVRHAESFTAAKDLVTT